MNTLESMKTRLTQPASRLEGSFAMDNLAAVAAELDRIWEMGIEFMPCRFFPTLATGSDLTLAAANFGIERKEAASAEVTLLITGKPGAVVDGGVRAMAGDVGFTAAEDCIIPDTGCAEVRARADIPGRIGNVPAGSIREFAAAYAGLTGVEQPEDAAGGADTESDADLLLRVKARWQTPSTGGNMGDYLRWALAVPGVSRVKVFNPSAGNVEVYLAAAGGREAEDGLLETVAEAIEKVRPVGAHVTVRSGRAVEIGVAAKVVPMAGYDTEDIRARITEALDAYLQSLVFAASAVSYVRIADILFVDGVEDITGYTVCGGTVSIPLDDVEFPRLGEVTLEDA